MKAKKRRKQTNKIPYIIIFATIVCLVAVGIVLAQSGFMSDKIVDVSSAIEKIAQKVSSQEPIETREDTTVNFIGVGDDLIHEALYQQAHKRANFKGYDFNYAYQNVADIIKKADIASINQETVMADIYEPSAYPMFNSPTQLGTQLQNIGFDVFNQANNHTIDKGEKGLLSTLDFWSKQNAKLTGVYKNMEDYNNIRTIKSKDITFGFIGITEQTNGLSLPKDSEIVILKLDDEQMIKERIQKAKEIADVVVVNVHWGEEYTHQPNDRQKEMAKKMVDWGADIILGHHPHVIQPVEYIERQDGTKGVVAYSLGNFISAQDRAQRMIGGMLKVSVTKSYKQKKTYLSSVHFGAVVNHYDYGFKNVRVYPLESYTNELASKHGVKIKDPKFSLKYINALVESVVDKQFLQG